MSEHPSPSDVQRDLTTVSEALLSLLDRLNHAKPDDAFSAHQRMAARENVALAIRNIREAIAFLNDY